MNQLPRARTNVTPFGSPEARYVFVAEQPDRRELAMRRMNAGEDAQRFQRCMEAAGIPRSDMYLTSAIKSQDWNIYSMVYHTKKSGVIMDEKAKAYQAFLSDEIKQSDTEYICALGNVALYMTTGLWGIHNWRGSIVPCTLDPRKKVVATLPQWAIRNKGTNNFLIESDLLKFRNCVNGLWTKTDRDIMINPSFKDALDFLQYCYERGIEGKPISYDIEVNNYKKKEQEYGLVPQVSCVSFAVDGRSMSIPFINSEGDYFPANQEVDVWYAIATILENKFIPKVGQNVIFDSHFLLRTYGIHVHNLHDTMIAQHTLLPEFPKGLDMITSLWTDHPYYKEDGKDFLGGGSNWNKFFTYNAMDSSICDEVLPKQFEQLEKQGNAATYERQRLLIEPLTFMMERGIKTDIQGMHTEFLKLGEEMKQILWDIEKICGVGFNPNSSPSCHAWFHGKCHLKPYKKRGKGGKMVNSYDETAMKRLIRKGYKEAALIQEYKKIRKQRANYLNITKVDTDGRYRCAFNPVGTAFSRLASKKNIFGTGSNLQNWPKILRRFLLIDKGYVGYAIDLSQAENRIVAYEGRVTPMIQAFEAGEDIHALTAKLLMSIMLGPELAATTDVEEKAPMCNYAHTWRQWGKKANHGFNYDWGYKAFAIKNEIVEKEGKAIYGGYHNIYPGVQNRYHKDIKDQLRKTKTITNLLGRKSLFLDDLNDQTFKAAYSCKPQGTVGEIINEYGLEYMYYEDKFDPIELLLQVHDEIIFQIPLNDTCTFADHARMLSDILNNLEPELTTSHGVKFTIPADLTLMKNLFVKGDKDKSIPAGGKDLKLTDVDREDLPKFARMLEETWGVINGTKEEAKG